MTRINIGILAPELSDQWLAAEIRELPRAFTYAVKYQDRRDTWPVEPTLGKGHVQWGARNTSYCMYRLAMLAIEAEHRGMTKWARVARRVLCIQAIAARHNDNIRAALNGYIAYLDTWEGRKLLIPRLQERYRYAKQPSFYTWTKRTKPDWLS